MTTPDSTPSSPNVARGVILAMALFFALWSGVSCGDGTEPTSVSQAGDSEPKGETVLSPNNREQDTGHEDAEPTLMAGYEELPSNDGTYQVHYKILSDPIPLNEPFDVEFQVVRDERLLSDEDARVIVDAAMPHHGHGMNRVAITSSLEVDRFRAKGLLFHMPGYWEIYFDIKRGAVTERAQVSVEID